MSDQGMPVNQILSEMRRLQAQMATAQQPSTEVVDPTQATPRFSDLLSQAIERVHVTQQTASDMATAFELGQGSVDLTEVMVASQKSSVSFQALTQVRNKLVQAYQDIMQMPV
ncbi:flagellar hook-basal body complex protein FliE [Azomonas agilis]|uniref:Flagellar hook-basal body complex protein FliE n=1 Tax=Azomonas agilis TaxID=116849 RepID=A0A562I1N6_9GAMM|nr:flagellar hook-basal body complex protein FliE [Azomonas agilis]TWH64959.1 flagellar hook-basal body complex protein FliE [Azomonas agilis]